MEYYATPTRDFRTAAVRYFRLMAGGLSAACMLFAAGCGTRSEISTSSTRESTAPESAFVMPAVGGPAIVSVIEKRHSSRVDQEILLANNSSTSGQNRFSVHIATHANSEINAPVKFISDMRAALPGVGMKKSPYFVQNRYGPFGYAIGRSGSSDLCIYSWQRIRTTATLLSNKGVIDVRLRLCETGATEQELLAVVYGYTIDAFYEGRGWNPYGDAPPPSPTLGARGPEIYPLGATRFTTVVDPLQPPKRRRTRVAKTPEPQPPADAEIPEGPEVPPPPSADAGPSTVILPSASPSMTTEGPTVPRPPAPAN